MRAGSRPRLSRAITIVGASARAAAASAVRAGFSVRAADLFADVDLRRIAQATQVEDYPAGFDRELAGPAADPWMYTGALENYPELVARWQQQRPLWGNAAQVLARVRNPQLVAATLSAAGLMAPAVSLHPGGLPLDESWLCKSLRSAGGMRVSPWDSRRAARSWHDCYFQQFVPGTACAAVYVAAAGQAELLGITRQLIGERWTGATGFCYCGSWGPWQCSPGIENTFRKMGDVLAHSFELSGLFGVDAVINDDGVCAIEVNPRYTASIEVLERARGFHAIDLHASACLERQLPHVSCKASTLPCGKALLFAPQDLTIPESSNAAWLRPDPSPWPAWADIPAQGTRVTAGMPLVTALASARDERTLLDLLQAMALQVQVDVQRPEFASGAE